MSGRVNLEVIQNVLAFMDSANMSVGVFPSLEKVAVTLVLGDGIVVLSVTVGGALLNTVSDVVALTVVKVQLLFALSALPFTSLIPELPPTTTTW